MAYTSHAQSSKKQGPRLAPSVRNGNLVRLASKLEPDLLASALRLREDVLKNYLQGREIPQGDDLLRIQEITYVPSIPHLPKGAKLAAKRAPIAKDRGKP